MDGFETRLMLTEKIEKELNDLFASGIVSLQRFGCKAIIQDNADLEKFIKKPEVNQQASAMIVKFAPDFILLKKEEPSQLYFLDVKHSVSPIWADKRIEMLRSKSGDDTIVRTRVGIVAREALLSYRRYYPDTIILMASPYNSQLLMAQFADRVRCLYCYRNPANGEYKCNDCPAKQGGFFDIERATNSMGSQTPMTDVDLDSFEPAEDFFCGCGIPVNEVALSRIKEIIRQEQIEFEARVDEKTKNRVRYELTEDGCKWIRYQVYTKEGNNFVHLDCNCRGLSNINNRLLTYDSMMSAMQVGKRKCKFCCNGL